MMARRAATTSIPLVPSAPGASSEEARKRMQANRGRDTAPELALRRELHRRGFRYRVDRAPLSSLRCRADLVFGRQKVAVFVDGCFWHGCPHHRSLPKANRDWWKSKIAATIARDRRNDAVLLKAGWVVVRVWEHEEVDAAADRVAAALGTHRGIPWVEGVPRHSGGWM
jgi:DNA mismatch endonuclease (patch repair protein)